jgi:outer membrane biosynthesis protein TonB
LTVEQPPPEATSAAMQRWYFNPATQGGMFVAGTVEVPFEFRLED